MKLMIILGALLGFTTGIAFSWVQESSWPSIIWRGAVAAYVAALLMRWWGRIWMNSIRQIYDERQAATLRAAAATPNPANASTTLSRP